MLFLCKSKLYKTMRYHITPVRTAFIKKSTNHKCWRGGGEKGPLLHYWCEGKLVLPLWRTVSVFKKLKTETFPGGPVVKSLRSQCPGHGFYPWPGNQIPHAAIRTQPRQKKNEAAIWSQNPTPGYISRQNCNSERYTHPYVHSSTIHNSQYAETT